MGLWKRAKKAERPAHGVALAPTRGALREELILATLEALQERSGADRFGVWLAETPGDDRCRGQMRDADMEPTPEAWNRLDLEAVFPRGWRKRGRSIAQEVKELRNRPLIGPLVGLRRALWAPVEGPGGWHGLLLAGWKNPGGAQPRTAVEVVAAELALALNLRKAEEAARERAREPAFARRVLTGGEKEADGEELREVLRQGAREAGMEFLAAGRLAAESEEAPVQNWTCADGESAAQLESEPLRSLWTGALESGRETHPERKPVSLNQIVLRALELQRFGAPVGSVRVETSLDPQSPPLAGDPDRLQQVVLNVVANAQQAIEHGSGHGTIRVATRRTGDGRLQLEVSDDGPGIPAALLARIFDPFFTTKPAGVGTGLGLSIVRDIVREHGGQVYAANRPGCGAVFTVELPFAEPERVTPVRGWKCPGRPAPAAPPVAPPVAERNLEALPRGWRAAAARVLVVEDEPTVARLIADVLCDEGMDVEVLLDASEALDRAARRSYDLVICDLKMPGLDGQHFYQALARQGSLLCERFLFVTGDALSAPTMDFLKRNRLAYVHKPFRVDELTRAVRETLKAGAAGVKHAAGRNRT